MSKHAGTVDEVYRRDKAQLTLNQLEEAAFVMDNAATRSDSGRLVKVTRLGFEPPCSPLYVR